MHTTDDRDIQGLGGKISEEQDEGRDNGRGRTKKGEVLGIARIR